MMKRGWLFHQLVCVGYNEKIPLNHLSFLVAGLNSFMVEKKSKLSQQSWNWRKSYCSQSVKNIICVIY